MRPLLGPILPYSIGVRNDSTLPVLAVHIYVDVVDAQGHQSSLLQGQAPAGGLPITKGAKPVLPPGRSIFFGPDHLYTIAAQLERDNQPMRPDFFTKTQELPAFYESARSITFVLDSLLLADGKFVGPDAKHIFEEWSDGLAADVAMAKAVLSFQGRSVDDLKEYLATASNPPGTLGYSRYARELMNRAMSYEKFLRQKGPDALFHLAQGDEERSTSLPMHR